MNTANETWEWVDLKEVHDFFVVWIFIFSLSGLFQFDNIIWDEKYLD
jgi:hypothetical protein